MVAAFLLLAMASHVTRMQTMVVVAQMRERRRRELLMQLLMCSNMPLTTQTRRKVERSPNGWRSSTMYGYVYGKDGVRNSDSVFKSNFRFFFFFFWKAHLIDQTNPRRHTANPPKEIHRVETQISRA